MIFSHVLYQLSYLTADLESATLETLRRHARIAQPRRVRRLSMTLHNLVTRHAERDDVSSFRREDLYVPKP